jgi:hypothetical protein
VQELLGLAQQRCVAPAAGLRPALSHSPRAARTLWRRRPEAG